MTVSSAETVMRRNEDVRSAYALVAGDWPHSSVITFTVENTLTSWKIVVLIVIESGMRLRNDDL